MTTQIDAMRKLSKKSTKDLKARYAKATGKSAEGWTRDSLIKELAMLAVASQDAPDTKEPAAENAAPAPETTTEAPPSETVIEYDEPNNPQPEESQDAAHDAAPEDTQMSSTKSKSKKTKTHRPPKPKAERKPKAAKAIAPKPEAGGERKPRLNGCVPGDTIDRLYKGETHKVQVTDGGFKYGGELYSSLTAVAMKITNAKAISGRAFFKLWTKRGD